MPKSEVGVLHPVRPQPLRQRAHCRLVLRAVAEEEVVLEFVGHDWEVAPMFESWKGGGKGGIRQKAPKIAQSPVFHQKTPVFRQNPSGAGLATWVVWPVGRVVWQTTWVFWRNTWGFLKRERVVGGAGEVAGNAIGGVFGNAPVVRGTGGVVRVRERPRWIKRRVRAGPVGSGHRSARRAGRAA